MNIVFVIILIFGVILNCVLSFYVAFLLVKSTKQKKKIEDLKIQADLDAYERKLLCEKFYKSEQSSLVPIPFRYETKIPTSSLTASGKEEIMNLEYQKISEQLGKELLAKICGKDISKILMYNDFDVDPQVEHYRAEITVYINPKDF